VLEQIVRGPLLIVREADAVEFHADGALAAGTGGLLAFAGPWLNLLANLPADAPAPVRSAGVMLPPFIDLHTHVSQHPIRGHFVDGVPADAPRGRLVEGLQRNVFPAEIRCADPAQAQSVARAFLADTLQHGVVGGAAYMTSSAAATEVALAELPAYWHVGQVLMDQNCPAELQVQPNQVPQDTEKLAARYGDRVIVTDRFALSTTTPLRRLAASLAARLGLRTQTHLNEQTAEKATVEKVLYPGASSYTDIYRRDGLLDHDCILAHCIHMRPDEWSMVADSGSAIAHCPSSNLLLGSGVMALDEVLDRNIPYAIATDVGASPTVSMLAEMARFLVVHDGRSARATACEALYRATLAPAQLLGLKDIGRLEAGRPMSFIEVGVSVQTPIGEMSSEQAIRSLLPTDLDSPSPSVQRVILGGQRVV